MTLRELALLFESAGNRRRQDFDQFAWLAHTTAKLSAYAPPKAKDFPKLEKLLAKKQDRRAPPPDWQNDFAKVEAWLGKS